MIVMCYVRTSIQLGVPSSSFQFQTRRKKHFSEPFVQIGLKGQHLYANILPQRRKSLKIDYF